MPGPIPNNLQVGYLENSVSWYAKFEIQDYNTFSGKVLHVHLQDPGDWDEWLDDVLSFLSEVPYVTTGSGLEI
jgi:hypothetical protein